MNGIDRRGFILWRRKQRTTLAHLIAPGTPFVLTVGRDTTQKSFNAVRGFLEAFGDQPEYRDLGASHLSAGCAQALLRSPQVQAQVLTLPYVTPEVINALYNAARILLHPSYYEGFGLPLIEAMAAGTSIVTSNLSSMPEVTGAAALLVSPANVRAIAEALVTLDQDEALRTRLSQGHKVACFGWAIVHRLR